MDRGFWIGVVSRSHVARGVAGGFVQLNHGAQSSLARLREGDAIAMYSPREDYPDGAPLQAFTAIGVVGPGEPYRVRMSAGFEPWRRDVRFHPCVEAPIRPLVPKLSFIRDPRRWSAPLRFGHLKITEADFAVIADAMRPFSRSEP